MSDSPVDHTGTTFLEFYTIVQHPAVRIGFLDARAGLPLDHDTIMQRILAETPPRALKRIGWTDGDLLESKSVEIAQYRYEEGRTLFLEYGVRCKAWGHPDYPPAAVVEFCRQRARENAEP